MVVDDAIYTKPPLYSAAAVKEVGETFEELEQAAGFPTGTLSKTMAVYNRFAAQGEDPLFHKHRDFLRPLDRPPYALLDFSIDTGIFYPPSPSAPRHHGRRRGPHADRPLDPRPLRRGTHRGGRAAQRRGFMRADVGRRRDLLRSTRGAGGGGREGLTIGGTGTDQSATMTWGFQTTSQRCPSGSEK
jgi:hypothetical protein